jgi:hypothetical protein
MLADLFFDVVLSGLLKIIASAGRDLAEGAKAVHRVADCRAKRPGEKHTAVEYVDAFLFPADDGHSPQ